MPGLVHRAVAAALTEQCGRATSGPAVNGASGVGRRPDCRPSLGGTVLAMGSFRVIFSTEQAAASLWDYGEDQLVDTALAMSDQELRRVWAIAAEYYAAEYPLPDPGQKITLNHVVAFATVTHLEGQLRPLSRGRSRPKKGRPEQLRDPQPYKAGHIG